MTQVIGIDCAVDPKRVGLALGQSTADRLIIQAVVVGGTADTNHYTLCSWLRADPRTLIALDAPLGWPRPLGPALQQHRAGQAIDAPIKTLFSRRTDRVIVRELKKIPFEVGANLIARTAYAALDLLGQLRQELDLPIPLAWTPGDLDEAAAIEVYPGATLTALKSRVPGYGKPGAIAERRQLLAALPDFVELPADQTLLERNPHALDGVICALAAHDFLRRPCIMPDAEDLAAARQEGWIWVRRKA